METFSKQKLKEYLKKEASMRARDNAFWLKGLNDDYGSRGLKTARKVMAERGRVAGKAFLENKASMLTIPEIVEHYRGLDEFVFDLEIVKSAQDEAIMRIHSCPFFSEWKKLRLSDDRIREHCNLACDIIDGNFVKTLNSQLELTIPKKASEGEKFCELVIKKVVG